MCVKRAGLSLLVIVTVAVLAAAAPARTELASLRVVAASPLTIAGSGFHSREHVRITATLGKATQTVGATATGLGTFRIRLSGLPLSQGRCDAIRVVAVGFAGTTAILKRLPSRACLLHRSAA